MDIGDARGRARLGVWGGGRESGGGGEGGSNDAPLLMGWGLRCVGSGRVAYAPPPPDPAHELKMVFPPRVVEGHVGAC